MAPRTRTELNITDPVTLRALAHPARQRLISELFSGEVLTATEAATIVGLSPSATSYHLRALEKAGIVTRDEPTADARERPWRSAADSISVRPEAHRAAGLAASQASMLGWFADLEAGLERASRALASGDDVGMSSRGRLWLTDDEVRDLTEQLHELVRVYQARTRSDHPKTARPWDMYAMILPSEHP